MQIHVVTQGQSLWGLSQLYGIPYEQIVEINGLTDSERLVVGQTLLIPTANRYTVQKGDSFYSIARKLGVSVEELKQINPDIQGDTLYPGQVLTIPQRAKTTILSNAFGMPTEQTINHLQDAAPALTYVSVFSYHVNNDGSLKPLENDDQLIQEAKRLGVKPFMTITNIGEEEFSTELATAILQNNQTQTTLINNIVQMLQSKGYVGVNVDFEYLGSENREPYNQFLRRLTDRLHQNGYLVSTSVAPKTRADQSGVLYEGHDYSAHGDIVDFVVLMTYEWGWSGGPPMPVSPLPQVREVINFAITQMPKEKIVMGVNLYGYDWTLPYEEGGEFAEALSPPQAVELAANRNTAIQYDEEDEAPFFNYYDQNGTQHIVWFEDLRSMQAKFDLVKELGIAGVSYWNLAFDYPPLWSLMLDRFNIRQ